MRPETLVVPAAGPTYGLLLEHARMLRGSGYPTAMVLPQQGITTSGGVATGIRRFVEAAGMPALVYIKHDGFLEPTDVAALVNDGLVSGIKYATVRPDPAHDPYLRELVGLVDPRLVISGIGEQPAIVHLRDFGLGGFTTGCGGFTTSCFGCVGAVLCCAGISPSRFAAGFSARPSALSSFFLRAASSAS